MDINTIRSFFKWCTIINGGLLVFSSLVLLLAGDWVFQMHSQWIPLTREFFNVAIYCLLGFFKIIVLVFNLVPYIVLKILK
ncbi:MAG: hypothetical protein A2283_11130 [Lentisphaerae bacterium RIFOXYA12_FULL_48_11]|nr:MAG: hypothetical protein A2283_11130 [Lentisphaerae bacterium RIFOXYA12_FULL_48_11]